MKMLIRYIVLFWVTLASKGGLWAQEDYQWWNEKHNWDGITPWYDYLITSPAFFGPNALPVPTIKNGLIAAEAYGKLGIDVHRSVGDQTYNLYAETFLPIFSDRVGMMLSLVPLEYYQMDTITRDLRKARGYSGEGFAVGDLNITTLIQLIEHHSKLPDVLFTMNLRTASGSKLTDARYTDGPGYSFDLSIGKDFKLKQDASWHIRPHVMFGFYVWQNQGNKYMQNDAFLYGLGFDLEFAKFILNTALGGYSGFIGNGDRPIVYRSSIRTNWESRLNMELQLQQGIRDFGYRSFRLACMGQF